MSDVHCAGRSSSYPSSFFWYNRSQIAVTFSEDGISQTEQRYFLVPGVSLKVEIFRTDGSPTMVPELVQLGTCVSKEKPVSLLSGKHRALSWFIVSYKFNFRVTLLTEHGSRLCCKWGSVRTLGALSLKEKRSTRSSRTNRMSFKWRRTAMYRAVSLQNGEIWV